jgi:cyclopropane fatty-acyl-phospholipid synthase-like methyltransferase
LENDIVQKGYARIASTYASQRDQFKSLKHLERFAELIPAGSAILDVGCGAGKPVDEFLVQRGFEVHGLDISPQMIELARSNVPEATYEIRDMSDLQAGDYRVDGIVSIYAIFHTPRERHQQLLERFASFMPDGGALLITMGSSEWEGTEADFHGAEMYWSHYGPETNRKLVEQAGFRVIVDEIDTSAHEAHQIVIATMT